MIYNQPLTKFENIIVKPKIVSSLGESANNCLADIPPTNKLKIIGDGIEPTCLYTFPR